MNNAINWFEIPTVELDRATRFYESMLGVTLKREVFGGMPMSIFPREEPAVGGALVRDPKRQPSAEGVLIYLDARGDLDGCLARVAEAGGRVLLQKIDIGPPGYIALVEDTEGNQIGLHTPRT